MMKRFFLLALLLGGCLPDYDNHYSGITGGDMAMPPSDMPAAALPCTGASGKTINGRFFAMELLQFATRPFLRVEGCEGTGPAIGVSAPSDGNGVSLAIPKSYFDAKTPRFLIAEGDYTSQTNIMGTALKTWFAPRFVMDAGPRTTDTIFHFSSLKMDSVHHSIAKELAAASKIDAADAADAEFAKHYTFAYGWTAFYSEPLNHVGNTSWSIDGDANADKASCNPKTTCCVFYANGFDEYFPIGMGPKASLLDLAATKSAKGYFAVVCPDDGVGPEKAELTLTQTSTDLRDRQSAFSTAIPANEVAKFAPFQIPRKRGEAVIIEYFVVQ